MGQAETVEHDDGAAGMFTPNGLRACYQYLGVDPLTTQQEHFLLLHLRGMSIKAAAQAAGFSPGRGSELLKEQRVQTIREYFRAQLFRSTQISLDMLNSMALEAHRKSANATEEYKGIEVLARLNELGGYAPQAVIKQRQDDAREKDVTPRSQRQLEQLPEDKLIELAGLHGLDGLDPEPISGHAEREPISGHAEREPVVAHETRDARDDDLHADYEVTDERQAEPD